MMHAPGTIRLFAAATALLTFALAFPAAAQPVHDHESDHVIGCGKARALQQRYLAEQMAADWRQEYERMLANGEREALEDTDLRSVDLEIEILPSQYDNMDGTCTLSVQSKSANLSTFTFRLRNQYNIDNIYIGAGTPVTYTTPSTTTRVATLDRVYGMNEIFDLTIEYSGHAESRGFGSIEFASHFGTDIVYTLSEAYYAYTWWPAKDGDVGEPGNNGDKFLLDIAIIAPNSMITASNGVLQGIDNLPNNRNRYRWASNYAISTYLVCFSSTNYDTWQQTYFPLGGGTMPVDFYIYPESNNAANRAAWDKAVDMLYAFRDIFGEYPFVNEKYGIYDCQFGGGMEHQTFTAQGTFSESVTAHELAHQWWGDMITCKRWNDIWLNEGFASYAEGLWEESKPGGGLPALKSTMASMKYFGGGSIYVSDSEVQSMSNIFNGNTSYDKGAWALHMLRHVLGDDQFFAALAAYRAAYQFSAATTDDFQAVVEQFYPTGDLDWYFQEWIYGERAPAYAWGYSPVQVNGKHYLQVFVDQVQSASYQRFTMPIDIRVNGSDHVIFNDNDPEHFLIPLDSAPSSVSFDPDEWILWSSRSNTSYVNGPPKIVETAPVPGGIVEADYAADPLTVTFHTPVSTNAADYTLVGDATGPVSATFSYDSGTNTVTLVPDAPLPADVYTLTVADAVTANNSGQALDGEIVDPFAPSSLPSGEGVAGGDAVIRFEVLCTVLGDDDCDTDLDLADFARLQSCFTAEDGQATPGCGVFRFDEDRDVDLTDAKLFVQSMTGP